MVEADTPSQRKRKFLEILRQVETGGTSGPPKGLETEERVYQILDAIGLEYESQPHSAGANPDFYITNLSKQIIGEIKTPQTIDRGRETLKDFLDRKDIPADIGIITDGIQWQIHYIEIGDSTTSFNQAKEFSLQPVIEELQTKGEVKDNEDRVNAFLQEFSPDQLDDLIQKIDIFDPDEDISKYTKRLETEALELLRDEAKEKINGQLSRIQYYQSRGFRVARTGIFIGSILISSFAFLLDQNLASPSTIMNSTIIQLGILLLSFSIVTGTIVPVVVGRIAESKTSEIHKEYFSLELTKITEEEREVSKRELLQELLEQDRTVGYQNIRSVEYLQWIVILSLYLLAGSVLLIGVGIVNAIG